MQWSFSSITHFFRYFMALNRPLDLDTYTGALLSMHLIKSLLNQKNGVGWGGLSWKEPNKGIQEDYHLSWSCFKTKLKSHSIQKQSGVRHLVLPMAGCRYCHVLTIHRPQHSLEPVLCFGSRSSDSSSVHTCSGKLGHLTEWPGFCSKVQVSNCWEPQLLILGVAIGPQARPGLWFRVAPRFQMRKFGCALWGARPTFFG